MKLSLIKVIKLDLCTRSLFANPVTNHENPCGHWLGVRVFPLAKECLLATMCQILKWEKMLRLIFVNCL